MTATWIDTTITAEDAPIGVQLWPTISAEYADNFTLAEVQVVRTEARTYVRWVYRGTSADRYFDLGEQVAAKVAA